MNMKFYLKISSMLVAAAFLSTLPVEAQTFRQTKQGITGTTREWILRSNSSALKLYV